MTKRKLIKEIADHMQVLPNGPNTWLFRATIDIPMKSGEGIQKTLSAISCREEDYTGIFNGEVYNPTGGFDSADDLDRAAQEECITVEALLERIWADDTNEDNYESERERNLRLAEILWSFLTSWSRFSEIDLS